MGTAQKQLPQPPMPLLARVENETGKEVQELFLSRPQACAIISTLITTFQQRNYPAAGELNGGHDDDVSR